MSRVAIVTGGAQGMGLACAERLAADGAAIGLVDMNAATGEAAAERLRSRGCHAAFAVADVTIPAAVEAAVGRLSEAIGPPSILVNAAGLLKPTRFLEIDDAEWDRVVATSLTGTFLCARACLPAMMEGGWGRIVNFSSSAGKSVSTLGGAHYTAAKAGVLGLTRALAKEVAGDGVCVNAVCPGLIDTEMVRAATAEDVLAAYARAFPVSRLGTPEEVAALVGFLCSDGAAYITGASLDINGGDLMV